jgi:hypothetical protein
MNGKEFSESYTQRSVGRYDPNPERAALMESAYDWSDQFSDIIHSFLKGENVASGDNQNKIREYFNWCQLELPNIASNILSEMEDPDNIHNVITVNFHLVNLNFLSIWLHIFSGSKSLQAESIRVTQNNLAAYSSVISGDRAERLEKHEYWNLARTEGWQTESGILNEIDTLITSLEISIQHPHIAILPAPAKFESTHHSERNVDALVIDLKSPDKDVRGIQAKLRVGEKIASNVDSDYVTLVDGVIDLGSEKVIRPNRTSSREIIVPWPGQIALHHLIDAKKLTGLDKFTRQKLFENNRSAGSRMASIQAMQLASVLHTARADAHTLTGKSERSNNKKAAQIVVQRVMNDLYR